MLSKQSILQPLKFSHFTRREYYLALQLREKSLELRAEAQQAASTSSNNAPPTADNGESAAPDVRTHPASSSASSTLKVVAVIGRQYVPGISALWRNKQGKLWQDRMPKSFSPSTIDLGLRPEDPDVDHGGSRPVGHQPVELGDLFGASQQK